VDPVPNRLGDGNRIKWLRRCARRRGRHGVPLETGLASLRAKVAALEVRPVTHSRARAGLRVFERLWRLVAPLSRSRGARRHDSQSPLA